MKNTKQNLLQLGIFISPLSSFWLYKYNLFVIFLEVLFLYLGKPRLFYLEKSV